MSRCPFTPPENPVPSTLLTEEALQDPFEIYRRLRAEQPVAFVADQNFWLVTRYDDCEYVLSHPEKFSSREAVSSTNAYRRSPEALRILSGSKGHPRARTLIMSDPPEHTRYRTILQRALSPGKTLRQLTPRMQEIIDDLIDEFSERGECEFVREFAYPLPMRIVATILDFPPDQIDTVQSVVGRFRFGAGGKYSRRPGRRGGTSYYRVRGVYPSQGRGASAPTSG